MSFPNLPSTIGSDINLDPKNVVLLILVSIAFEELALAHIMNSEAEKLQAALGTLHANSNPLAETLEDLLNINRSVERMLRTVIKKEMLLQFKLEDAIEFFLTVTPPPTPGGACDCSTTFVFNDCATTSQVRMGGNLTSRKGTASGVVAVCIGCSSEAKSVIEFHFSSCLPTPSVILNFVANSFAVDCPGLKNVMNVKGTGFILPTSKGFHFNPTTNYQYELTFNDANNKLSFTIRDGSTVIYQDNNIDAVGQINDCELSEH
ncbi:hypothetical protein [Anoxybacteroides amylolyticum]|uniref:Uncharacterized protein n=1 Tax=Anoxybacteroides amylolyticum TaxID=294699 RepID=A0A167THM7_9BACL|nr:hypothetical protein GFC30_2393 [Anoxybacillus amylolyticus]